MTKFNVNEFCQVAFLFLRWCHTTDRVESSPILINPVKHALGGPSCSVVALKLFPVIWDCVSLEHGCRWETFYICAYCGLVGNPHLTAKM